LLGIDYGSKRVGLAVSDEMGIIATPLRVVIVNGVESAVSEVKKVCAEKEIGTIVVGLPLNMNGTSGPAVEGVVAFAALLREKTGLPVETWDERLSTAMVERAMIDGDARREKRRDIRDQLAAQVILQSYLDRKNYRQDELMHSEGEP